MLKQYIGFNLSLYFMGLNIPFNSSLQAFSKRKVGLLAPLSSEEQNVKDKMVEPLQQVELLDQDLLDCMEAKDRMAILISEALLKDKVFILKEITNG
jgi:hypothetical protein